MSNTKKSVLWVLGGLVIGLVANVFTSVFVSRAIFEFEFSRQGNRPSLSI